MVDHCPIAYPDHMSNVNVSLPDALKTFVDQQVAERGLETCSEYIQVLIQRELDRQKLRDLVMEGVNSPPAGVADAEYFDELRRRVHEDDWQ